MWGLASALASTKSSISVSGLSCEMTVRGPIPNSKIRIEVWVMSQGLESIYSMTCRSRGRGVALELCFGVYLNKKGLGSRLSNWAQPRLGSNFIVRV